MLTAALCAVALAFAACGGGDDDGDGSSTERTPAATSSAGGDDETPQSAGGETPSSGSDDGGDGRTWTQEEAQALLDTLLIQPADAGTGWTAMNDITSDNAAAAASDPNGGASFERCGRLLGRTLVLSPEDVVTRYVGGETVSFFSQATVYATAAGANDCSLEAAQRLSQCPELAKAFGSIFIDPNAVSCVPFDYPQVGDGSFGMGLSGQISAAGTIVELTIKIVAFRQQNVAMVVGMASAFDPAIDELTPLIDLVVSRLTEAQS
jgi:hypothetical protein